MLAALALAALATTAAAAPVAAAESGDLGIRPATEADFFHLSLYPGAAMDAVAIVSNRGAEPVTLLTYPVDGSTTEQGAFAFGDQSAPLVGVGSWMELEAESITVPANSEVPVSFRVSVPAGTPPGDYAGGLIIQAPPVEGETSLTEGDAPVRLDVVQRLGVRVYLNVAGTAVTTLDHGELTWTQEGDTITFTLPLHNSGNTILHPTGTLDLSGWIGTETALTFQSPESLLPGAKFSLRATLKGAPLIQAGSATAKITSEAGTASAETTVVYAPWLLLGIALLVLAAAAYGTWRMARFVRRAREAIAEVNRSATRSGTGSHVRR